MPNFNKNDFSGNPVRLDAVRSRFSLNHKHKTTFNAGLLIPVFSYGDVLPGDSFSIDMSCLVRMATPVVPVMDDCYMDVYFFFTPHKLSLSRQSMSPAVNDSVHSWNAFIGAQDYLLNMPTPGDVLLPFFYTSGSNGANPAVGSLTDYLGLPMVGRSISCLEPLAYYQVWNNYFRDENTMNPVVFSVGSVTTSTNPNINGRAFLSLSGFDGTARWGTPGNNLGNVGSILPVCRPHGYFGSALPWPQRNTTMVDIPLLGTAPVLDASGHVGTAGSNAYDLGGLTVDPVYTGGSPVVGAVAGTVNPNSVNMGLKTGLNGTDHSIDGIYGPISGSFTSWLHSDLTKGNAGIAVNALRLAVQTQRWYEALARGGNRIGEISSSMFGVTPSDYAVDRPEYLGGKRIPISMDQVASTNGASAGSLGALGAYSNTGDSSHYFTKSFDTWGTITAVVCVRTNESFAQGIHRRYSRKSRFDFFWPQFANLGEQPVLEKEIYVPNAAYDASVEEAVFGYQEAWAEYRYLPDVVSGLLRPGQSLGQFTYANSFTTPPTLSGYIDGTAIRDNVDRTLQVYSTTSGFQFIGDFAFNIVATRPMPRYSIPGLVDHH